MSFESCLSDDVWHEILISVIYSVAVDYFLWMFGSDKNGVKIAEYALHTSMQYEKLYIKAILYTNLR